MSSKNLLSGPHDPGSMPRGSSLTDTGLCPERKDQRRYCLVTRSRCAAPDPFADKSHPFADKSYPVADKSYPVADKS